MGTHYCQLDETDRYVLADMLSRSKPQNEIARFLDRHPATISREIRRNTNPATGKYQPSFAHASSERRKENSRKKPYADYDLLLAEHIGSGLALDWSPEQIAGHARREGLPYLNHESIYQYIYRHAVLSRYLRQGRSLRRKRGWRKHGKPHIRDRRDISLMPPGARDPANFGHWQGDTMSFRGSAAATYLEISSRYLLAFPVADKKAGTVAAGTVNEFSRLPLCAAKTILYDNGLEFARHKYISNRLDADVYFAKPYAPYQRGANENANGLLRWYLSRKMDLNRLPAGMFATIVERINSRPRKCLGYRTPAEVFAEKVASLQPRPDCARR